MSIFRLLELYILLVAMIFMTVLTCLNIQRELKDWWPRQKELWRKIK